MLFRSEVRSELADALGGGGRVSREEAGGISRHLRATPRALSWGVAQPGEEIGGEGVTLGTREQRSQRTEGHTQ